MKSTHVVSRRDRAWTSGRAGFLIGPLPMPPIDQIRDAVAHLIRQYPNSRLNWRLDANGQRWIADRPLESIVTEGCWDPESDYGRVLEELKHGRPYEEQVNFVRYPDYLGMAISHRGGDGRNMTASLGAVAAAMTGGDVPEWASSATNRFPLLTAGVRTFGRHPATILRAVRDRPPIGRPADVGLASAWTPAPRTEVVSFPKSLTDELTAWGNGRSPRPSRFALTTCALLRALAGAGIEVDSSVSVLVDLRRYLGQGWIDGNFVANVPLRIDPETTPELLSAMVKATMRSGRPLANQMLTSWRTGGRRRRPIEQPRTANVQLPARVTVTDLGDLPYIDSSPVFADGRACVVGASGLPDCPNGITAAMVHTTASTTISLSFHDNAVDAHKVRRALDLLASSPVLLMTERTLVP